jgi:malate dehydrogenase (quinone)
VQVMKKDAEHGGILQFGTEVIIGADGSIAGLLGASPGASTAVPIMLDLISRSFPEQYPSWLPKLKKMIPSLGTKLNEEPAKAKKTLAQTAKVLDIAD